MPESLIRLNQVEAKTGYKKSMVYDLMSKGVLPGSIRIGDRAVAWIASEIDSVIDARILGKTEEEIRTLVRNLIARRKQIIVDELTE